MMRNLKADEARVMGVLCVLETVLICVAFIILPMPFYLRSILMVGDILWAVMAWLLLSAKNIHMDGTDLLIEKSGSVIDRVRLDDVSATRTWPCLYKLSFLKLNFSAGNSVLTVVREQDLTWIMSRMPTASITPYWRRRIGT